RTWVHNEIDDLATLFDAMLVDLYALTRQREALFREQAAASAREIAAHQQLEAALQQAHDALEQRVQERTAALAAAHGELRQMNAALESRVRARTAELEAANRELEAFSYSVSHDLRAPLRAIDGFSQAVLDDYGGSLDDAGRQYLHRIRAAVQRMAELIDDMLRLARVTRSDMLRAPVNLSALAEQIAASLQQPTPERQVIFAIAPGICAEGDARLLRILLENLLGNAWKFTAKHPTATIAFGVQPGTAPPVYFVRDDGAGFDMTYASRLFGAFQRLHDAGEFAGTGIGLATVARIAQRHGGRAWAEGAVEQGATVYFTLAGTGGDLI
ncbi:MAG TPA: ATP-binding protein, partial [Chloroflexia bacterium]|nr:ATP-binding protein [Chloroflexia bacterium]